MPWELLARDGSYLSVSDTGPLLPVRAVSATAVLAPRSSRRTGRLRVLFMATSPEGVEPVLSYEAEEAGILAATADTGTELVVEESGTLEGLRFPAESTAPGTSMSCTSAVMPPSIDGRPAFVVEDEFGGPALATADQIARAMAGQWPRLVFVSGCLTGERPRAAGRSRR